MENTDEMYNVVILNDDTTPRSFFVEMLNVFFQQSPEDSGETLLSMHDNGRAVVGTYPKEKAERLASILMKCAETQGYKSFRAAAEKAVWS